MAHSSPANMHAGSQGAGGLQAVHQQQRQPGSSSQAAAARQQQHQQQRQRGSEVALGCHPLAMDE